ncbi:MAG: hypothetical protein U9P42_03375 [Candidatus Fermentibacteria bacterium]|nr:hypothetical protein [Candidatus Fermentibacteria bacterium]
MKEKILAFVPALAIVVGLMALAILGMYTLDNQSGYTGVSPYVALYVFIPVIIAGVLCGIARLRIRGSTTRSFYAILIGGAGIVFLIYLDKSVILLQYCVWLIRGTP